MINENVSKILGLLPREKAFYFFTSIGNYTGVSASSLEDFIEKVSKVNVKSLEFHFYRKDFEKWISEALEDKELASKIEHLRSQGCSGTMLKARLLNVLTKHYEKLIDQI